SFRIEDTAMLVVASPEKGAGSDVARDQVAVSRVHALQEVVALALRDTLGIAAVFGILRNPYTASFAARALGDEAQLVGPGDRGRVDLDELAVGVDGPLSIGRRSRGPRANDAVGGPAEDDAGPTGCEAHRIPRKGADLHRFHVL